MREDPLNESEELEFERALGLPLGWDLPSGLLYRYRQFDATELRLLMVAGQIRFANASYFNDP